MLVTGGLVNKKSSLCEKEDGEFVCVEVSVADLFKGVFDGVHDAPSLDDICGFGFVCGLLGEDWLDQSG